MSSKPTTCGYFMMRMRDSGYRVEKVFEDYAQTDPRSWTVVIDPGFSTIFCTCFINRTDLGDNHFEFYDGGQFLPNIKVKTASIDVLIETLVKYGINRKVSNYEKIAKSS